MHFNYQAKKSISENGFTIIELIVVLAVFLFIIGAAIGIFLSIISSQREVLSEQQVLNQISYVNEYISKALRMAATGASTTDPGACIPRGYIYELTRSDGDYYAGIKFLNQSNQDNLGYPICQEFFLESGILKEIKNGGEAVDLTSSDLKINKVRFALDGTDGSVANTPKPDENNPGVDNKSIIQPRVTMLLNVTISNNEKGLHDCKSGCTSEQVCSVSGKCTPTKTIQTTVSRRNLNIIPNEP